MEIQQAMVEKMDGLTVDNHSPADAFSEAVMQSYTDMLGRSRIDMRFTSDGLVIDSNITFK